MVCFFIIKQPNLFIPPQQNAKILANCLGGFLLVIAYNFNSSLRDYAVRGVNNYFPRINRCPHCRGMVNLIRHGFYWRNAIEGEELFRIPICRLKCPSCNKTVSLLPNFLIPYFQYTVSTILDRLKSSFIDRVITGQRQLTEFYRKRYLKQLKQVEMFFRDDGFREPLPTDSKEKAIKLLEMILALGKATFVRRSTGHFIDNFMAN